MTDIGSETALRHEAIELLRARGKAYYRHVDMGMVRRIGGFAVGVVTLVSAALLLVFPPTVHVPPTAGWAIAAVLLTATAATAGLLSCGTRLVTVDVALAVALGVLAALAVLDLLAAPDAPFDKLVVLAVVWVGVTHTPRRVLAFLAVAGAARLPTLAQTHWAAAEAAEAFVQVVVWLTLGALALLWSAGVRAGRVRLERAESRAKALARVDQLTGLGNRRAFDEMVGAEIARAERTGRPLSVVVADLDDFKAINDSHGHLAGDDCLRQVAAVVSSTIRRPDACFRWGGDEFALLLAETDLAEAEAIARRLQGAVATTCRAPDGRTLTLGCGAAQYDRDQPPDALVADADRALLLAKA
jgi:diguanylate cyclase (GGDEF)-like protein